MNNPSTGQKILVFSAILAIVALNLFWSNSKVAFAASDYVIYDDSLNAAWWNGSWNTTLNLGTPAQHESGGVSVSAAYTSAGYGGIYFGTNSALSASSYNAIRFWIYGGSAGGQHIAFKAIDGGGNGWNITVPVTPVANIWTPYTVTLASVGNPATIGGVVWQDTTGGSQPTFFLDNIGLIAAAQPPPPTLALTVNASADRHAISPYIYGMNFADTVLANELHLPVDRYGGNATTRYNYLNDTANRASDWFFENIPNNTVGGSESDVFVEKDRTAGARTIMTMPLIGWTPKDGEHRCGFGIAKYGPQDSIDAPWHSDCGNGIHNGADLTGNDPLDTSMPITQAFDAAWVQHFVSRYSDAANGGVMFYDLDNEPMLWNSTHRDVHPNPTSYDEMRTRTYAYAPAIKAVDPSAKILGPTLWGWSAYFDSAVGSSDRVSHGSISFLDWYLQQMKSYEQANGMRVLDYLDIHFYPQNGVALESAGDANKHALRLRSTRALWDPSYADESWIASTSQGPYVRLIPRMRDWVNTNYPGTKIALGEYNWGALDDLNGALAEADILGIFGREALDLAALWAPPSSTQPGAFAFRMYRNYDGTGKRFGDMSVRATSTVTDSLAVFAAQRAADNALTIIVVNKTTSILTAPLSLAGFSSTVNARVFHYSASNLNAIVSDSDQVVGEGGFIATYPASSITLFVLPPSGLPTRIFIPTVFR